jgi:hypothetical protein
MKRKYTDGNIVLPIVIIIALVLIGILGYIFWTSGQQKTDTTQKSETTQSQDETDTITLQEGMLDNIFPTHVSWKYPETWTSAAAGPAESGGVTTQTVTITSPSGAYSVVYKGGMNGGIGGACIPGDAVGTLQHVSKQDTETFKDAVFAEFIYDTYSIANSERTFEGYDYIAGLFKNDSTLQATSVGDSYCNIYLKNTFALENNNGTMLFEAGIKINAPSISIPSSQTAPITAAFDNEEYREAVKILLSTSITQ